MAISYVIVKWLTQQKRNHREVAVIRQTRVRQVWPSCVYQHD